MLLYGEIGFSTNPVDNSVDKVKVEGFGQSILTPRQTAYLLCN